MTSETIVQTEKKVNPGWLKCRSCGGYVSQLIVKDGECPECVIKKLKLKKPQVQQLQRFFYNSDTIAGKLERYLRSKNIDTIGEHKPRRLANGEKMPSAFELDREERAMRTLIVKQIDKAQLDLWHKTELQYYDRLIFRTDELYPILHKRIRLTGNKWTEDFLEYVDEYNKKHLPELKKYDGYIIPQYFIYDLSFDGMFFNHAWDEKIYFGEPINYEPKIDGRAGQLRELMM